MFIRLHPRSLIASPLLALSIVTLAQTSNLLSAANAWDGDRFPGLDWDHVPEDYDPVTYFHEANYQFGRHPRGTGIPGLDLGANIVNNVPRELLSTGNHSLAQPNEASAHSENFEYTTPGFNFPTFPFASGTAQIGFGRTNWHLSGNGWMTTNPPRSFVTGTTTVDLQVNAYIDWGYIYKEKVLFVLPSLRGSMTFSFFYLTWPYVEFKKDIKLVANASCEKNDRQTKFSFGGTDSLDTAVHVRSTGNAGINYVYRVGHAHEGVVPRVAARGRVIDFNYSQSGTARLTSPMRAGYDRVPTPAYEKNCIWTQFDELKYTIIGTNFVENEGMWPYKYFSNIKHSARASNVYSATRRWFSGISN
jgi:hypothetical protein